MKYNNKKYIFRHEGRERTRAPVSQGVVWSALGRVSHRPRQHRHISGENEGKKLVFSFICAITSFYTYPYCKNHSIIKDTCTRRSAVTRYYSCPISWHWFPDWHKYCCCSKFPSICRTIAGIANDYLFLHELCKLFLRLRHICVRIACVSVSGMMCRDTAHGHETILNRTEQPTTMCP